jgi:branched-chain amino acid transport system substrate-binding protein
MRRALLALGVTAVAAAILITGASGGSSVTPGVTAKLVTIGGTFPLSGPASSYAPIPAGMKAYFSYVNASRGPDHKRGVGGRQILFKYLDDGYNPANTVQQTKQLVEQDHVFALVGGLGTEPQEAVVAYANQQKVPQIYVSTGATEWGAKHAEHPYTIGWQPDYQAESALYGRYIASNLPNAKVGIIYQNDSYGRDYIAGLEAGLGKAHKNQIVATRGFEVTDTSVLNQVIDLQKAGVDTMMIFGTPTPTIRTYATMKAIGWKPANIFVNSVSGTSTFLGIASSSAGAAEVNGSISTYYQKDTGNAAWDNDAGMKLYRQLMAKYLPNADAKNGLYLYGMAKAYTFVQALRAAGTNLTRASLMTAVLNMNDKTNPFLLPGVVTKTGKNDYFPVSQQTLQIWNDGKFTPSGGLIDTRPKGL